MATRLEHCKVASTTLVRYKQCIRNFLIYCRSNHIILDNSVQLDNALADYINDLYTNGDSLTTAEHTLYAILFFCPEYKNKLHTTVSAIDGWRRIKPHRSHPPLTWPLTALLSVAMAINGHIQHSIATLVAFDGFLRIGEMIRLQTSDIQIIPHDSSRINIAIAKAKTGKNQSVVIYNPHVIAILRTYIKHRRKAKKVALFDLSEQQYRTIFSRTIAALGLSHMEFTPHSLRHGAATWAYFMGEDINNILARGRWTTDKARQRYIQTTRAILIRQQIPRRIQRTADSIQPYVKHIILLLLTKQA